MNKDPVRHCQLYKDHTCAHVDGFLCNVETCKERIEYMKEYSEEYDAYYDALTNTWLESKCDDPTCEFCFNRPERPLGIHADYETGIRKGAEALAREIDREAIEIAMRKKSRNH